MVLPNLIIENIELTGDQNAKSTRRRKIDKSNLDI
jgi:hypothetical protein